MSTKVFTNAKPLARLPMFKTQAQRRFQHNRYSAGNLSKSQSGASMAEFLIVVPLLMFTGMGVAQIGLLYHAKSMLNYATFEAARSGAVKHAQIDSMRQELGYRMAPVFGGSGRLRDAPSAITRSVVIANDPSVTKIEILNPTAGSFALHGRQKEVLDGSGNVRQVVAIPNSHLRLRDHKEIKEDGLNVQDANLLKIRVTYGYQLRIPFFDLEVPGLKWVMRTFMVHADPENWMYYIRGMLPIRSTATVRMQSEAWDQQQPTPNAIAFESMFNWTLEAIENQNDEADDAPSDAPTDAPPHADECDEHGLIANLEIEQYDATSCHQDQLVVLQPPQDQTVEC